MMHMLGCHDDLKGLILICVLVKGEYGMSRSMCLSESLIFRPKTSILLITMC